MENRYEKLGRQVIDISGLISKLRSIEYILTVHRDIYDKNPKRFDPYIEKYNAQGLKEELKRATNENLQTADLPTLLMIAKRKGIKNANRMGKLRLRRIIRCQHTEF